MDPFKAFAKIAMALIICIVSLIILVAIISVFQGNFFGILLILFVFAIIGLSV